MTFALPGRLSEALLKIRKKKASQGGPAFLADGFKRQPVTNSEESVISGPSVHPPKANPPFGGRKDLKNVIAQQLDLLVEIRLPGGTKIIIDVATQL